MNEAKNTLNHLDAEEYKTNECLKSLKDTLLFMQVMSGMNCNANNQEENNA